MRKAASGIRDARPHHVAELSGSKLRTAAYRKLFMEQVLRSVPTEQT